MASLPSNPKNRSSIAIGSVVDIVQKEDQRTGRTVQGTVAEILTGSAFHPHGIKVRLADGKVGRVKAIRSVDKEKKN
jgi:uncharacterized repeat protein (TIGR03833 family)